MNTARMVIVALAGLQLLLSACSGSEEGTDGATQCGVSGKVCCAGDECQTGLTCTGGTCRPSTSCGASNFTVSCPDAGVCPTSSTCAGALCDCQSGAIALNCSGVICSGACAYPNWWCAPRIPGACGPQNFTVPCDDGAGGTFYCPTYSDCNGTNQCNCASGTSAIACDGHVCNNDCSFPGWWCH